MKHVNSTLTARAERIRLSGSGRFEMLSPVRILRRELGLTPNDLAVLAALVSFLPREEDPRRRLAQISVVFPSNVILSERANGLNERTIRRCLWRLCRAGLIARRNSATGKRFPLRRDGVIETAFGIDLAPLAQAQPELLARARTTESAREYLRSLRAQALAMRIKTLQAQDLTAEEISRLEGMRNTLRRATLTCQEVEGLIAEITAILARVSPDLTRTGDCAADPSASQSPAPLQDPVPAGTQASIVAHPAPCPDAQATVCDVPSSVESGEMSASDGQNVRHIESTQIEYKNPRNARTRDPSTMAWQDFEQISTLYPEPPGTAGALKRILFEVGAMLRIQGEKVEALMRRHNPGRVLLAMESLVSRSVTVRHPGAYLEAMLE